MTDGRLLVPAGAAWLGAAVASWALGQAGSMTSLHQAAVPAAGYGCAGAAAVGLLALAMRRRWPGAAVPAIAGVFLLVGVAAVALTSAMWSTSPLAGWVDARATAVVDGVVSGEPQVRTSPMPGWQAATWWELSVTSARIEARGGALEIRLPVRVRLPSGSTPPPPGTRITVVGRLGRVPLRSGHAVALAVRSGGGPAALTVGSGPGLLERTTHGMRTGLTSALAGVAPDAGSLVAGLAVGDDAWQPPDLTAAMRASGLSHLTAVSGGNVAVVLGAVLGLAAAARLRLALRVAVAAASLAYFVLLVGPQPSVLRASVMGAVAVGATLTGGRRAGPSVLSTAVLALVVCAPWLATSWAFALSAFATAGLILLVPPILDRLRRWRPTRRLPPALAHAAALTLAAQLATLPLLVAMGGATGWVAVPANLAAMPVVPPVTVLGLVAAAVAPVLPGVAQVVAELAAWPAGWIATVARTCAGLPLARLPWPEGWWGLAALGGIVVIGLAARAAAIRLRLGSLPLAARATIAVSCAVLLAVVVIHPPARWGWPPPRWLVIMCDVGQGDALLLRAGEGSAVVVDAGPDGDAIDRCLDDAAVSEVPALVLTHFHADHVRGLAGVLRDRPVGAVLLNPVREPLEEAAAVDAVLDQHGIPSATVAVGDAWSTGDVTLQALWPRRRIAAGSVPNNASVVLTARVRGRAILLAGDIEPEAQAAIAPDLQATRYDVVKVPHHGSRYQSPRLTAWAPAAVALVSVGEGNDYGHPAPETLAAWAALGAVVARTDRDGDVAVVSSGSGLGVVSRSGMLPSP